MSAAERAYRLLLRLYPPGHRREYGSLMVLHARDLHRAARRRGPLWTALTALWLALDGLANAGREQLEVLVNATHRISPTPWLSVLLAIVPGLLVAAGRGAAPGLDSAATLIGWLYLLLVVFGAPVLAWRSGRFPVWALLPAGALLWVASYLLGLDVLSLNRQPEPGNPLLRAGLAVVVALVLFGLAWRGRPLPARFWGLLGLIVVAVFGMAAAVWAADGSGDAKLADFLLLAGVGLANMVLLLGAGLVAARQHGLLALLLVLGGHLYWFTDTDYLFGYASPGWAGRALYMTGMTLLVLVIVPVGLLRARSRRTQALAVFGPLLLFGFVKLLAPFLVLDTPVRLRPGDVAQLIFLLLNLLLAWTLFRTAGPAAMVRRPDRPPEPQPGTAAA